MPIPRRTRANARETKPKNLPMAVQSFEICGHFGEPVTSVVKEPEENVSIAFSFDPPDPKTGQQKFKFKMVLASDKDSLFSIEHEWLFRTYPLPLTVVRKEDMDFAPGLFASMINLSGEMVRKRMLADGHRLELSYPNILKLVTEMLDERLPSPNKV